MCFIRSFYVFSFAFPVSANVIGCLKHKQFFFIYFTKIAVRRKFHSNFQRYQLFFEILHLCFYFFRIIFDNFVIVTLNMSAFTLDSSFKMTASLKRFEFFTTISSNSSLTAVHLIRSVSTVISEVTNSAGLDTHAVVALEHILWTQWLRLYK